jgi:hypothetical protein
LISILQQRRAHTDNLLTALQALDNLHLAFMGDSRLDRTEAGDIPLQDKHAALLAPVNDRFAGNQDTPALAP